MEFFQRLAEYREEERRLVWEGTFADYLPLVVANPRLARTAHARLYDMIVRKGVEETPAGRRYAFFAKELFGLEAVLERLVEDYFHAAAHRLDVRRRILLLVGPVGAGKSTIVNLLKRGLEEYSRTEEGALYAIKDCPMHEDPLHLIPQALRADFARRYGIQIEGELCPYCRLMVKERYAGCVEKVPVRRIFISEEERVGIGTFSPSDPKSQDIADLTGSVDFATIGQYGTEADPRAYCFDGELNKANRGLLEFQELLKVDERFLYHLLSLSQEGNFKAGRFALISADEAAVASSDQRPRKARVDGQIEPSPAGFGDHHAVEQRAQKPVLQSLVAGGEVGGQESSWPLVRRRQFGPFFASGGPGGLFQRRQLFFYLGAAFEEGCIIVEAGLVFLVDKG